VDLEWDEEKRGLTLRHRKLDFAHAAEVFAGIALTVEDDRRDYGEVRYQTYGRLGRNVVQIVWTPRGEARRIISMRKCNGQERQKVEKQLG
jgi:uncharacterized DUF497 family protein